MSRNNLISVALPRDQVEAIYELTVARAVALEGAEAYMGPHTPRAIEDAVNRYRGAADELRVTLDSVPKAPERAS